MLINDAPVHFRKDADNNLHISFGNFHGLLSELLDFRRSFDYECYAFGNARFTAAVWKTIRADDNENCKYPRFISLKNDMDEELILNWEQINELISNANVYLQQS